jgi:DNA-binding beta-propeller fold protein YncE
MTTSRCGRVVSAMTVTAALVAMCGADAVAEQPDCNQATRDPVVVVNLPGTPFLALPSHDGCWVFVSMPGNAVGAKGGIGVVQRTSGATSLARVIPVEGSPTGMTLTSDGALLIAAAGPRVAFIDTTRAISGTGQPVLGYWSDEATTSGHIYVNLTRDDRYLFVSQERAQTITVIDLPQARSGRFTSGGAIGKIPTGRAPIALTFSPDERYLYTTSQAMVDQGWPLECRPESAPASAPDHPQGAVLVIDVALAETTPARSVVSIVRAGCNPVRVAIPPAGDLVYVTARGSHALLAFDRAKLLTDPLHAQRASVPVGTAPVGVAVVDSGRKVLATSSNRFAGNEKDIQSVTVVDATKMTSGAAAVLGSFSAGAFPREMRISADGHTLFLTNFASRTLQIVDLDRLHWR